MRRIAPLGWMLLIAFGTCAAAGCAPRPRYLVERSAADFMIDPDFRDLRHDLLAPGLGATRTLFAGNDSDAALWLTMGAYHLALGERDSAEACDARAVEMFERSMAALPANTTPSYGEVRARADAYVALGVTLAARGDYALARRTFARVDGPWSEPYDVVRGEKAQRARFATGVAWELEGRPREALGVYDAALAHGEWPRLRYARACAWAAAAELDSALSDFERVAASNTVEARLAPYHAGRIREMRGDTVGAITAYERFVDAQTNGLVPPFRNADSLAQSTRDEMIAGMERVAEERTHGLYRDAQARLERLRTAHR